MNQERSSQPGRQVSGKSAQTAQVKLTESEVAVHSDPDDFMQRDKATRQTVAKNDAENAAAEGEYDTNSPLHQIAKQPSVDAGFGITSSQVNQIEMAVKEELGGNGVEAGVDVELDLPSNMDEDDELEGEDGMQLPPLGEDAAAMFKAGGLPPRDDPAAPASGDERRGIVRQASKRPSGLERMRTLKAPGNVKQRQFDSEAVNEDDEKISYIKLKGHILQAHPRTAAEKTFGVCDAIGTLPMCNCCFEREEVAHDPRMKGTTYVVRITPLAQQLGLGATLFMMTTKAMFWFFFWMSIINIPTMMFFYSGNVASIEAAEAVSGEAIDEDAGGFDVAQLYGRLSLGNIGQSLAGCVLADPNQDTRLMACSYGTMKTPETLLVGFSREDGVACGDEVDREIVDETCNSEASLFTSDGLLEMEAYFEVECLDRAMCDMPPPNIRDWLTPECQAAYDSRQAGQVAGVTNLEIVF